MLIAGANFLLKRRATRLSCHKGCSICCAVGSWRVRDRNGAARDEWNDQTTKRSDRGTRSNLDAFDVLGSFKNPQIIVVDSSYIQVFLHTMSWRWTSIWNCLQLCVCWSFASWDMLKGTHWPVIWPMKSWNLFVMYIPAFLSCSSQCFLSVLLKFHSIPIKDHLLPLRSAVCLKLVIPRVIRIEREPRCLNTGTSVWESEENRRSTSFDRSTIDLP